MRFRNITRTHSLVIYLIATTILVFSACTREVGEQARLGFNFNKLFGNSAQSLANTTFVAVNVTGEGMPRVVYKWDQHDHCPGDCLYPPPAPVDVYVQAPAGPGRLVQILVVTEDPITDVMDFYYGDVRQDLKSGDQVIDIPVASMGVSSATEGSVHGRYLDVNGNGFTGGVVMSVRPTNGSPAMEIFKGEIFAGWFSLFLLDGVNLEYRLANGHLMFGTPIQLNSSVFTASDSVLRLSVPTTYQDENNNGTYEVGSDRMEDPRIHILGFFKNGLGDATAGTVCYDNTAYASTGKYLSATSGVFSNPLDWVTDYTIATTSTTCSTADPLVSATNMIINGQVVEYAGGDGLLFEGPFLNYIPSGGTHYDRLHTSYDSGTGTLNVNWKYLTGVLGGANPVAGTAVFYSKTAGGGNNDSGGGMGGIDCSGLLSQGFQVIKTSATTETAGIPNISSADLATTKIILCPMRLDGSYFHTALKSHCIGGCGGGGTNGGAVATKFSISDIPNNVGNTYVNAGACIPFFVSMLDANNNRASIQNWPHNINIDIGPNLTGVVYPSSEPDCLANQVTFPYALNSPDQLFFVKITAGTSDSIIVNSGTGNTNPTSLTSFVTPVLSVASNPATQLAATSFKSPLVHTSCEAILFQVQDANGEPVAAAGGFSIDSITSSISASFYDDSACITPLVTTATFPTSGTQRFLFYDAPAAGSETISFGNTASGPSLTSTPLVISVNDPGAPGHIHINFISGSLVQNTCAEFEIEVVDNAENPTPLGAAEAVNFSFITGSTPFYANSTDCGGNSNTITSLSVDIGTFHKSFWIKPPAAGALEFRATPINTFIGENMWMGTVP